MKATLTVFVFLKSCVIFSMSDNDIVILKTNNSSIVGARLFTLYQNKPYAAFWRVPFALPPIDKLRFKPPKTCKEWDKDFSYDYTRPHYETCFSSYSEDCLYISIYMPLSDKESTFPILVWVHEASNNYGPDFFIDEDIILVTVSYRTSIMGFLNTGDDFAEGNMGAKDILLAIKWTRDNIHIFNGDGKRITVAGSGRSATIIASLLVSSAAKDLLNRVIVQSGSALSPSDYTDLQNKTLEKLYWKFTQSVGFDRKELIEILSKASKKYLMKYAEDLFDSSEVRDRQRLIHPFGPTIERSNHSFMNNLPLDVYRSGMANIEAEVMLGYTSLEAVDKLKDFAKDTKLLKHLNYIGNFQYMLPFHGEPDEYGSKRYNKIRRKIMDFYFINGTLSERSLRRYVKYVSDQIVYPLIRQARLHAETSSSNVYLYRFSYTGALNIGREDFRELNFTSATSGDETCYLFRCYTVDYVYTNEGAANERHLIRNIVRLWANFIKYGNPTPKSHDDILGSLNWEPLRKNLRGLNLDKKTKMVKLPEEKRVKFWDDLQIEYFSGNDDVSTSKRDEL